MRDRRRGGDDAQRWVTTYSDVVTLLLAFFVLLFAMSEISEERFEEVVSGLQEPFGNSGLVSVLPETDGLLDATKPPSNEELIAVTTTTVPSSTTVPDVPPLVLDRSELLEIQSRLEEALDSAGFENAADFRINERGLVVSIATDELLFPSGSAELGGKGERIIGAVAPALIGIANPIQVEGHTDDVPYDLPNYDNWNLSADRALAVLHLLIEEHGIDPARMGATGYASHRPLETNETEEGRAANRRVELVILVNGGNDE